MANIYSSGEYASLNPSWHQEHSQWKADQVIRMFQRHGLNPKTIAELGCGAGGILASLHDRLVPQPSCVGYEISPQAFAMARKREANGLKFVLGPSDLVTDQFDVVLAMDVFEHVEDYLGFIRGMKKIGVWKILHIPLDLSLVSIYKPILLQQARDGVGHLHYFTRETAIASLEHAGLSVKDWFYTSVEIDHGPHGRKRLHSLREFLFTRNQDLAARWLGGFSLLVLAH